VIVGDFNVVGIVVFPLETNPPLFVDSDAVLADAACIKGF
jgi:hypothetical protein